MTPAKAAATVRWRLEQRERTFLEIVRRCVYAHPDSPYLRLLELAGCEYGDLERLIRREGVEGALHSLYRHGVYLTVDEFKSRRPARRGNTTIEVLPAHLLNPQAGWDVPARSSGSRGLRTMAHLSLEFIRDCAADMCLALDARGALQRTHAMWETPGGGGLFRLLKFCGIGAPPARWFSQMDPASPTVPSRHHWILRGFEWSGNLSGIRVPQPQHVPLDDPVRIARWMAATLAQRKELHVQTFASSAVRLAQCAADAGIELWGVECTLMGEPITTARLATIRRSGAEGVPRYGSIETGPIGYACLLPSAPDEVHLLDDLHAVIQPGEGERGAVASAPPEALFITALSPAAPFILLNVSMGDRAVMTKRHCHCPMESAGWRIHLHTIRSFEKLTGAGVTFLDSDVVRVLEEVLPNQFGGGSTDYQLVEDEEKDGHPYLRLLIHPRVGAVDPDAVGNAFLAAIAAGSRRLMTSIWHEARLLRVERRVALTTASGKILHLVGHQPARHARSNDIL